MSASNGRLPLGSDGEIGCERARVNCVLSGMAILCLSCNTIAVIKRWNANLYVKLGLSFSNPHIARDFHLYSVTKCHKFKGSCKCCSLYGFILLVLLHFSLSWTIACLGPYHLEYRPFSLKGHKLTTSYINSTWKITIPGAKLTSKTVLNEK